MEKGQISNSGTSRQAGDLIVAGTLSLLPPVFHSKVLVTNISLWGEEGERKEEKMTVVSLEHQLNKIHPFLKLFQEP
jgi:hypothetical protein